VVALLTITGVGPIITARRPPPLPNFAVLHTDKQTAYVKHVRAPIRHHAHNHWQKAGHARLWTVLPGGVVECGAHNPVIKPFWRPAAGGRERRKVPARAAAPQAL